MLFTYEDEALLITPCSWERQWRNNGRKIGACRFPYLQKKKRYREDAYCEREPVVDPLQHIYSYQLLFWRLPFFVAYNSYRRWRKRLANLNTFLCWQTTFSCQSCHLTGPTTLAEIFLQIYVNATQISFSKDKHVTYQHNAFDVKIMS